MKRRLWTAGLVSLLLASCLSTAFAAGTVTTGTASSVGSKYKRYVIAWTSDGSGVVSGNTLTVDHGLIVQAETIPSASSAPTDLYDMQIKESAGSVNVLGTAGDNLSATAGKLIQFVPPVLFDGIVTLELSITNAGATKSGTVILWVEVQ